MTRLVIITTLAASLLLWSASVYSASPYEFPEETFAAEDSSCHSEQLARCNHPHCRACAMSGHRVVGRGHAVGLPGIMLPSIALPYPAFLHGQGLGSRLGFGSESDTGSEGGVGSRSGAGAEHGFVQRLSGADCVHASQYPPPMATVPMPVGPPPNNFVSGVFRPQQYQQVQPMVAGYGGTQGYGYQQGQGHVNPQGQGNGYAQGHGNPQGQGNGYAPSHGNPQGQGYGNPQGYYGYPQGQAGFPEQRIVYVPYAAPPSIHVQRFGGAMPRPQFVRRILGDARMYEYPEMPSRLYTTRGPRDFMAPNPPGIGE